MSKRRSRKWPEKIQKTYEELGQEIWALFYAQCSDADAAYDALQESFSRLLEQNGAEIRDIRAWVLQVGRNWLKDSARRKKIAATPTETLDYIPGQNDDPHDSSARRELRDNIREAFAELKPGEREALILRYSLNWSSNRIADVLNTTSTAVDMRLSRARKRLAEVLKKSGMDQ